MPLTSLWLRFPVERPLVFQSFSGFASRGVFFEMLRSYDEEWAHLLHSGGGIAPYSTTPIIAHDGRRSQVVYRHLPACLASLRICLLEHELSKAFLDILLSGDHSVRLLEHEFPLTGISVQVLDFQELLAEAKPVRKFALKFKTPCFFRRPPASYLLCPRTTWAKRRLGEVKRFVPLPDPILMFKNLVRLWRAFSNKPFCYESFMEWVELGGVALSGFPSGLKTVRLYEHPDSNKWAVGFMGTASFVLPDDTFHRRYARIVDALLRFAEFSNVGGNRTAGFGVVEYKPTEYAEF